MTFYISHNFAARDWLTQTFIPILQDLGHNVQARWITEDHSGADRSADAQERFAREDYLDISNCDYVIHFSDEYGVRAGKGKFMEVGYAQAVGKRILVVGEKAESSVFYFFGRTERFLSMATLMVYLSRLVKEPAAHDS